MMAFNRRTKVFACSEPTDMRKSFDGLYAMARDVLNQDPLSGHLFVFVNQRRTTCKCLYWDGSGLVIMAKRLEGTVFYKMNPTTTSIEMTEAEFALFFEGADFTKRFIESPREYKIRGQQKSSVNKMKNATRVDIGKESDRTGKHDEGRSD
jgi:transposase